MFSPIFTRISLPAGIFNQNAMLAPNYKRLMNARARNIRFAAKFAKSAITKEEERLNKMVERLHASARPQGRKR